jgi:copper chaperone CopZ
MEETHEFLIEGMHCDGCVRRVKASLEKLAGVEVEEVKVGRAKLRGETTREHVREAIEKLGFRLAP